MDLTIHRARLDPTGESVDVGIVDGVIVYLGQDEIPAGDRALEAKGALLSPAFIDPHFHLENALISNHLNRSGTLREAIDIAAKIKSQIDSEDIVRRSCLALREAVRHGTLWLRSHTDIDQVAKLQLLEGTLAVREKFRGIVDIQVVAFPQLGLTRNPEAVELMWAAMERGADVVGGMPHGEKNMDDAARHIEIAFEIAKKFDADIDMHVDETDDPYWHTLELLAEKTLQEGYQGRVTAGHCCAMAAWTNELAEHVIQKVRDADVSIVSNAPVNLLIQGRQDEQPVRRGITRVKQLLEAGVNVSCGQDDLMNMFYPFGRMDMLEVANFVAHAAQLSSPREIREAFDMPRHRAAKVLRLSTYDIQVGHPANLVLIDAQDALDAVRRQADRLFVIGRGEVLAENQYRTFFSEAVPA